jgi:UDP-perosamine 4-acetyltransferase
MENSNRTLLEEIYVVGAGGHAQSTFSLIANIEQYRFLGFFDDLAVKGSFIFQDYRNLGTIEELLLALSPSAKLAIGIGYSLNQRAFYFEKFIQINREVLPNLIHPNARIDEQTNLAVGVHIHSGGIVRIGAEVGDNVLINSGAIIDHHVSVGSHSMISPGAILCGRVKVGNRSFIGAGAIILPGIEIGDSCVIGAGTLVTRNVPSKMMCIGNPGEIMPITENAAKILGDKL